MRHGLGRVAVFVFVATSLRAAAAEGPDDWLVRMTEGARATTYQGVVIYRSGDMLETLRIFHRYRDGHETERLSALSGEPREVLRQDGEVTCILPNAHSVTVDRQAESGLFPAISRGTVTRLRQFYELKDLGDVRVAGRQCHGIEIRPRDAYRYGYQIWIDRDSGVPLVMSVVDRAERLLEQLMFTEVEFPDSIPDEAFNPKLDMKGFTHVTRNLAGESAAMPGTWTLNKLPPGFQVMRRDLRVLPDEGGAVEHLMLTDGLSAVSIYSYSTGSAASGQPYNGLSHMGALHAYGRSIGERHVTVVGEVPQVTVKMIGDGLAATAEASSK